MDHKKKLADLHKEMNEKLDDYLKAQAKIGAENAEKLQDARNNWQTAWVKLQEILMVLEQLEL